MYSSCISSYTSYVDHVTPESGKAEDVAKEIIAVDTLQAIMCDRTNTNTEQIKGIIKHLECSLGKPLQWSIRLVHANELPLPIQKKRSIWILDENCETLEKQLEASRWGHPGTNPIFWTSADCSRDIFVQ